jgi:hypothetical protein
LANDIKMTRKLPSDHASLARRGFLIQKYLQLFSREQRTQLLLVSWERFCGIIALLDAVRAF